MVESGNLNLYFVLEATYKRRGLIFIDKYAPVVSCSTVILIMTISLHRGCKKLLWKYICLIWNKGICINKNYTGFL